MWYLAILLAAGALGGAGDFPFPTRGRFLGPSAGPLGPPAVHIPLPAPLSTVLRTHVRGIIERGWAEDLTSEDFDHGHLLMKPGFSCGKPCTQERVAAGVAAILYHTAEHSDRWSAEGAAGIPVERRTHRSIIGWLDGRLEPAIDVVAEHRVLLSGYETNGTVFDNELPRLRADLFGSLLIPRVRVEFGRSTLTCSLSDQFDIQQDAEGRWNLPDGRRFDAYLVCAYPEGKLK